ncbi:MAG: type II toxin-antitoxin system RelE/ParE family toxin [Candidatus Sericytochromatia bacterium]|nr:type II toxin-antitoxin system RelE/ParE family toxin [Candidatus Sericytochromatia bacterium]
MLFQILYFHSSVRADIEAWPDPILADYARIIELLMQYGPQLGLPHSRAMGNGLFELRARGKEGMGRAFYCYKKGQKIIVLHSFIKKTQKTPERELKIAQKRLKEVKDV